MYNVQCKYCQVFQRDFFLNYHDLMEQSRIPLNRQRIIEAAVEFADANGLETLSMRKLGAELGVEAMSLYNHVRNKEDIHVGMIDYVFSSIPLPPDDLAWQDALRSLANAMMDKFASHSWALSLKSTNNHMGMSMLIFMERLIKILHDAGFNDKDTHHALQMLGSHAFGYAFQQVTTPASADDERANLHAMLAEVGDQFPHVTRMAPYLVACDFTTEYAFGLDIIIDGLASRLGTYAST